MAESKTTQQTSRGESERALQQSATDRPRGRSLERREAFSSPFIGGPLQIMRRMAEEMDRMFDRVFDDVGLGRRPAGARESLWVPRIEAFQKQDRFIVRAELPGLKKEDIQVDVTDDTLTIQGERRHEQEEEREGFYHTERSYGSFSRTIPLPDGVIGETAEAVFRDGVLEIAVQAPPAEVGRGRRLEIKETSA